MQAATREDVWLMLSDLWLDTELDQRWLAGIADVLRRSGLSRAQLEAILLYEVAPVVWLNHWNFTGVWGGFDSQWLLAGCRRNQQRGRWHRYKCRLLRWPMTYGCQSEWQQILGYLAEPPAGDAT